MRNTIISTNYFQKKNMNNNISYVCICISTFHFENPLEWENIYILNTKITKEKYKIVEILLFIPLTNLKFCIFKI